MFSENKLARKNGVSARMTLGDWLKFDCLSFLCLIPVLGSIAYLVIFFIIAFSSKTSASLKTRAQANLVWALISLVIYIVLIIVLLLIGIPLIEEITNSMYYY